VVWHFRREPTHTHDDALEELLFDHFSLQSRHWSKIVRVRAVLTCKHSPFVGFRGVLTPPVGGEIAFAPQATDEGDDACPDAILDVGVGIEEQCAEERGEKVDWQSRLLNERTDFLGPALFRIRVFGVGIDVRRRREDRVLGRLRDERVGRVDVVFWRRERRRSGTGEA
jgi:hypothetical protein